MKILLTGAFDYTSSEKERIAALGLDYCFLQQERDSLPVGAENVELTVCNGLFLHHSLDVFPRLKYIQLTSAGFDRVPMKQIKERGITLYNARGVYSIPMAEWALCKVLEVYKGTAFALDRQARRLWEKNRRMRELSGKRVAILGAGSVGREAAIRFGALGANVVGYDIASFSHAAFRIVKPVGEFRTEVVDYDIIIITLPLTEQTKGWIDEEILVRLKDESIIVNISRGGVIDERAMTDLLRQRTDVTAVLDVFANEPLPMDSALWSLPNVVVSPHNSFVSEGNHDRMFGVIYSNLKHFVENA